jgi:hypothetical protein
VIGYIPAGDKELTHNFKDNEVYKINTGGYQIPGNIKFKRPKTENYKFNLKNLKNIFFYNVSIFFFIYL